MSRSNQLAGLITATPTSTLDTINEINTSLNNDANLSTTLTNSIATKANKSGDTFTGNVAVTTSNDGGDVQLSINNSAGSGSTDETVTLKAGQAGTVGGKIVFARHGDYNATGDKSSTLNFYTADDNSDQLRMHISKGGNVGIGTTSPTARVHLSGTGTGANASFHNYNTSSATYIHNQWNLAPNMTANQTNVVFVGKESNTKNSGWIGYKWVGDASNSNTLSFGHWGNDHLMNLTADGKLGIGLTGPNAKLHVRESGLFTNSGTDSGYSYAPTTPILTVTTDGNGFASTTYQNNAVFKVGIGGGDAGTVTSEYFRVNVNGRIKHNDYYLPKENEVTSSGTSHNPIPFANLWGTDTTLIITMVAITWSASNGQDGGGHGYALLALDRHFGSYGTHVIQSINTAPHNNSGYLPSWSCDSGGLKCTTKSAGYRFSYTVLGNTSTA